MMTNYIVDSILEAEDVFDLSRSVVNLKNMMQDLSASLGRAGIALSNTGKYFNLTMRAGLLLKERKYEEALHLLDDALACALYQMNMDIEWVRPVQSLRLQCFKAIRESRT